MEFTYLVIYRGKIIGRKSCIAPNIEAFEFFIRDKVMRHLRLDRHSTGTGYTFSTEFFNVA